jgi:hypothetical protein
MYEPQTWHELLKQIIADPPIRQSLANELGVVPVTLTRWANSEVTPRRHNLHKLLDVLPPEQRERMLPLLEAEFPGFTASKSTRPIPSTETLVIPNELYVRVVHSLAYTPRQLRFSSLCDFVLQRAIKQLDPYHAGIALYIVLCSPGKKVHSLRESFGRGTAPWPQVLEQNGIFLGAESLAGHAVIFGRFEINQNLTSSDTLSPGYRGMWEESAVAAPLLREGRIAGCLLVSSTQPDHFLPVRCQLIEQYAELLALALDPEEFHEPQQIDLGVMPASETQRPYLLSFRNQVAAVLKEALREQQLLTMQEAEARVWQQIEAQLLRISSSSEDAEKEE